MLTVRHRGSIRCIRSGRQRSEYPYHNHPDDDSQTEHRGLLSQSPDCVPVLREQTDELRTERKRVPAKNDLPSGRSCAGSEQRCVGRPGACDIHVSLSDMSVCQLD